MKIEINTETKTVTVDGHPVAADLVAENMRLKAALGDIINRSFYNEHTGYYHVLKGLFEAGAAAMTDPAAKKQQLCELNWFGDVCGRTSVRQMTVFGTFVHVCDFCAGRLGYSGSLGLKWPTPDGRPQQPEDSQAPPAFSPRCIHVSRKVISGEVTLCMVSQSGAQVDNLTGAEVIEVKNVLAGSGMRVFGHDFRPRSM